MKFGIYTIQDLKTGFMNPVVEVNDEVAKRNFAYACSADRSMYTFSPDDFRFFKIGTFDAESGIIEPINPPQFIADPSEV